MLTKALQQLNLKESQINLNLFTEKVLPNYKAQSVLLIPKYKTNEQDEYENYFLVMDAIVLVVDNASGKILYQNIEPETWVSDAMIMESLVIDTGLYILADQKRAFGVRVNTHNTSGPNPFALEELKLYLVDNKKLNRITDNITVYRNSGDWDIKCNGEFSTEITSIEVDNKNKSNGLNNLKLKTSIKKEINTLIKGDCKTKIVDTKENVVLKFNGKTYK
ncbi:hypothetical protein [Soonwooa sp.]|uniref:hypothetical protein n=1 Tax=Soonwooa sp. TaxID=1938592 RepID=UPI00289772D5|nr:hypothetical protein [Soonwooa sp.]